MPCILFVDELLAAYPSAKVILTERDVDSWVVSMNKTVFEILSWRSFHYIAPLEPVSLPFSIGNTSLIEGKITENRRPVLEDLQLHPTHLDGWQPQRP